MTVEIWISILRSRRFYGKLTWDVWGHTECHLEAKLEVTIFAYSLERGMSITDEIRILYFSDRASSYNSGK